MRYRYSAKLKPVWLKIKLKIRHSGRPPRPVEDRAGSACFAEGSLESQNIFTWRYRYSKQRKPVWHKQFLPRHSGLSACLADKAGRNLKNRISLNMTLNGITPRFQNPRRFALMQFRRQNPRRPIVPYKING